MAIIGKDIVTEYRLQEQEKGFQRALGMFFDLIEKLTNDEGEGVEFLAQDPEAFKKVKTIDCIGAWTNWNTKRFEAESWYDCLTNAVKEKTSILNESEKEE